MSPTHLSNPNELRANPTIMEDEFIMCVPVPFASISNTIVLFITVQSTKREHSLKPIQ